MNSDQFGAFTRGLAQMRSRRQFMTVLGSGLAAALLGASQGDIVAQGNSGAAEACQQGGYSSLVRGEGPHMGEGFETVGECVSYAAQGGTLQRRLLGGIESCALAMSYDPTTHSPSLSGLNLSICDLSLLKLMGADLSYASIIGGYLPGADLTGADLTGVNLYNANLNSTVLRSANLSGANLYGANLAYADLTGAVMDGAIVDKVIWGNTTCPDGTNSKDNRNTCLGHL